MRGAAIGRGDGGVGDEKFLCARPEQQYTLQPVARALFADGDGQHPVAGAQDVHRADGGEDHQQAQQLSPPVAAVFLPQRPQVIAHRASARVQQRHGQQHHGHGVNGKLAELHTAKQPQHEQIFRPAEDRADVAAAPECDRNAECGHAGIAADARTRLHAFAQHGCKHCDGQTREHDGSQQRKRRALQGRREQRAANALRAAEREQQRTQPARTQGHENAQQHDRCGEHADAAQRQQHGADRFGRDAGDGAVLIAGRCDPLRQILQQLCVHLRLRDGLARGVRQRREPQHGHAAVHDGTVEHIDDLLRAAVAKRLVARAECLVEPEALDHAAGVPVERVPIRKDTAGLVPVFNEHERAAAFAQRVEHLRLRQRLGVGVDAGLSGGGKRVIPRGKEICAALCKAAGLRRAQPRILRGAHDVRIGKLCRCDQ